MVVDRKFSNHLGYLLEKNRWRKKTRVVDLLKNGYVLHKCGNFFLFDLMGFWINWVACPHQTKPLHKSDQRQTINVMTKD